MLIKDLTNLISECIGYADEISQNPQIYPSDARMPLKDLLRYDMIVFLGYLYEPNNPNFNDQIEYIKKNLRMILIPEKFLQLVDQRCNEPDVFFHEVPQSVAYFIEDDLNRKGSGTIARSKFIMDSFRKLGEGFLNYDGVQPETLQKLDAYIDMLSHTLVSAGLIEKPHHSGIHMRKDSSHHSETVQDSRNPNIDQITSYDTASGHFSVKKAVSTSGYNIMKKRADDVSEFANFQPDEDSDPNKQMSRGKNRIGANRKSDESEEKEKSLDELIQEMQDLIGLDSVKEDLMHLINIIKIRKLREIKGLKRIDMTFHLVFTGNPGTGKTTVARLLAKIYKQLGVVSRGQFIEVDRSGLVDHFSGGTAQKTTEVINRAIGGILFIDEAYTLTYNKDSGDYGQEAVDTLLKRMEDDRDDFIVIVAGYPEQMREFIESNPGLKSRFNKFIHFPDYSASELMDIFRLMCRETDYKMTESAAFIAETYLRGIAEGKTENFANARLVRNYFERCIDRQANRLVKDENMTEEDLVTFVREDMIEKGQNVSALPKDTESRPS